MKFGINKKKLIITLLIYFLLEVGIFLFSIYLFKYIKLVNNIFLRVSLEILIILANTTFVVTFILEAIFYFNYRVYVSNDKISLISTIIKYNVTINFKDITKIESFKTYFSKRLYIFTTDNYVVIKYLDMNYFNKLLGALNAI